VRKLVEKCQKKARQGFKENMAFVGILSSQILYHHFVVDFLVDPPKELKNTRKIIQ
jgi:asparagine synthase (glutamine-hydrolysing)